ncbi:MAG: Conserved beta helix fold protein [candidate division TM6 bacterium GW2011_GWF2_33_332]|nr:MAG: Conserved beta helix fold protein [candidate division TM6 bacterium GW2011_GWF2_33_332]
MRIKITFFVLFLFCIFFGNSQTTVTLYPNIDANIKSGSSGTNYGTETNLEAGYDNRGPLYVRYLIKFDLSTIPEYAVITDAKLTLYGWSHLTTSDNSTYVKMITSTWDESTVTWTNKPTTSTTNYDTLANATSTTQDFEIDFTSMVNDWINYVYVNNGVMFQWYLDGSSTTVARKRFYSSDYTTDPTKVPKLEITYIVPTITTIYPNKDAVVKSSTPTVSDSINKSFIAKRYNGFPSYIQRSLMQFEIPTSTVPQNSVITSAVLRLKGYSHVTPNNTYLKQLMGSWIESGTGSVTWNNQPQSTTTGQIQFGPSTSSTQEFLLNITDWTTNWWNGSYSNYGFIMQLVSETTVGAMNFNSSDATTEANRPYVKVAYVPPIALSLSDKSICNGDNVTIGGSPTATGGTGVYTYAWSPATGLSSTTIANPVASPTTTTTYTVTVTDYTGLVSSSGTVVVYVSSSNHTYTCSNNLTYYVEGGTYYDDGGTSSNYGNNLSYTQTFYPCTDGKRLKFFFSSFSLETCGTSNDYLEIYDGPNVQADLIDRYCGGDTIDNIISTHETGSLTFKFYSNSSGNASGWKAYISEIDYVLSSVRSYPKQPDQLGSVKISPLIGTEPFYILADGMTVPTLTDVQNWIDTIPALDSLYDAEEYLDTLLNLYKNDSINFLDYGEYDMNVIDTLGNEGDLKFMVGTQITLSDVNGLTLNDENALIKTGQPGWTTGRGTSKKVYRSDSTGKLGIVIQDVGTNCAIGFRDVNDSQAPDFDDLDYGFYITGESYSVMHKGTRYSPTDLVLPGDVFVIEIASNRLVRFFHNGTLVYSETAATGEIYYVDYLIHTQGRETRSNVPGHSNGGVLVMELEEIPGVQIVYNSAGGNTCSDQQNGALDFDFVTHEASITNIQVTHEETSTIYNSLTHSSFPYSGPTSAGLPSGHYTITVSATTTIGSTPLTRTYETWMGNYVEWYNPVNVLIHPCGTYSCLGVYTSCTVNAVHYNPEWDGEFEVTEIGGTYSKTKLYENQEGVVNYTVNLKDEIEEICSNFNPYTYGEKIISCGLSKNSTIEVNRISYGFKIEIAAMFTSETNLYNCKVSTIVNEVAGPVIYEIASNSSFISHLNNNIVLRVERDASNDYTFYVDNDLKEIATIDNGYSGELKSKVIIARAGSAVYNSQCSFNCFPTNDIYAVLKKELDGGFHLTNSTELFFKYLEEYYPEESKQITYRIYPAKYAGTNEMESTYDPIGIVNIGDNRFVIDIQGLASGDYILEVENEKSEKWYLKFKV